MALRGWGLSRVCSRHGGVGRLLACDTHLPSSAPLPCSPSRSPCSGTPSAGSHSLLKGQGTLLREMGNLLKEMGNLLKEMGKLLKEMGNLLRGSGSPLEGPGSLWCSLCAPQIQVLCPAYSLQKEKWLHLSLKNSRFCTCESNFCLNRRGEGRRRRRLGVLWTPRTPGACRHHFDQVRWVWTGAEMEVKPWSIVGEISFSNTSQPWRDIGKAILVVFRKAPIMRWCWRFHWRQGWICL